MDDAKHPQRPLLKSSNLTDNIRSAITEAADLIVAAFDDEGLLIADSLGVSTKELHQAVQELEAELLSRAMQRGVAQFDVRMGKMESYFSEHNLVGAGELSRRLGLSQREFVVACEIGLIQPAKTPYDYAVLIERDALSLYYPAETTLSEDDRQTLAKAMHQSDGSED